MRRRVAVIDCGTNTFNLRIVDFTKEVQPGLWYDVFSLRLPVKLGKGGVGKGIILPERITRGLDAVGVMLEAIRNYKAKEVYVIATSALRDASNSREFVERCMQLHGLRVNIISGSSEATLIQSGLELTYMPDPGVNVVTMDIGGGSTEFIIWNREEGCVWSRSFNVGVARLANLFNFKDRFSSEDSDAYEKMKPFIEDELQPLKVALEQLKPSVLIGCSGSFDTFSDVMGYKYEELAPGVHPKANALDTENLNSLFSDFMKNSTRDRLAMDGMSPDRAENIPYAVAISRWVLEHCDVDSIYRSQYALREGVLNRLSKNMSPAPGVA